MAIHKVVFYSPDRRIRITADPVGRRFTVERDLILVTTVSSLAELERALSDFGLSFGDLIEG